MVFHHRLGPELTAAERHAVLALRVAVFVVEQACPYPEVDGRDLDADTGHRWVADDAGVACYLRTLRLPADGGAVRIGRVVTRADRRGQGLAARLLAGVLADTDAAGFPTVLDAQTRLQAWYGGFGYAVTGPEFLDDGVAHVPLHRAARPAGGDGSPDTPPVRSGHHQPAPPGKGARC
ncbi:MAG: GNAT family N-acetyltransferase [Acidimicrobiales bacterium]